MDLEPIKKRLAAATPGPWEAQDFDNFPGDEGSAIVGAFGVGLVAYALRHGSSGDGWYDEEQCDADATFIAHAPEDIAALVAEVERLTAQIDAVKVAVSNHPNPCTIHPNDDPVTCGWKNAFTDVVKALEVE